MADLVSHGPKWIGHETVGYTAGFWTAKKECNLILEGQPKKKSADEKADYLRLWAGSIGRKHMNSLKPSEANLKKPNYLFDRRIL